MPACKEGLDQPFAKRLLEVFVQANTTFAFGTIDVDVFSGARQFLAELFDEEHKYVLRFGPIARDSGLSDQIPGEQSET